MQRNTDRHGQTRTGTGQVPDVVRAGPCRSVSPSVFSFEALPAVLAANGALSLLNVCIPMVKRQMQAQADAFEREGGFTERLYRRRTERRAQEAG